MPSQISHLHERAPRFRVAICGGGASAVLLARALTRRAHASLEIVIVEPRPEVGLGRAYSTACEHHLLNVPAASISAEADDPLHFVRWLNANELSDREWTAGDFAPRKLYGQYLRHVFRRARNNGRDALETCRETAVAAHKAGGQWQVELAKGTRIAADVVVLATGNEAPAPLRIPGIEDARQHVIADPWDEAHKSHIRAGDRILLLGSGLTAIDVALQLWANGHHGPITLMSRHGLLPSVHGRARKEGRAARLPLAPLYPANVRTFLHRLRKLGEDWQVGFDALRPINANLWAALPEAERRRFLRHLRTYWTIHRHRAAPEVGARIANALKTGALTVVKGRLARVQRSPEELEAVSLHAGVEKGVAFDWLINCTEPNLDPARSANPLISSLVRNGVAARDPLGLGLRVDTHSRVIDEHDSAHETLFALGPLTTGRFWEITAIPEIRAQADAVGRRILELANSTEDRPLPLPDCDVSGTSMPQWTSKLSAPDWGVPERIP